MNHSIAQVEDEYNGSESMPLRGFGGLVLAFSALCGAALWKASKQDRFLRSLPPFGEVANLAVASHKAARLITHDQVLAPFRAPFVEYKEPRGKGAVKEKPRGSGPQRAVGELITCPYCTGLWTAAGATCGYLLAPRATRTASLLLSLSYCVDLLNVAWAKGAQKN
jgi:hypothetical protein